MGSGLGSIQQGGIPPEISAISSGEGPKETGGGWQPSATNLSPYRARWQILNLALDCPPAGLEVDREPVTPSPQSQSRHRTYIFVSHLQRFRGGN
jgi:hypothetical protein